MDKTSQKVTKDLKCVEADQKGRENDMNKSKENILNDAKKGGGDTTNASNETISATYTATAPASSTTSIVTTRSNDTYIYGVGILAVLAIGVSIFFTYNKKAGQVIHEEPINQKDVICFRSDDEKTLYNKLVVLIGRKTLKTLSKMD